MRLLFELQESSVGSTKEIAVKEPKAGNQQACHRSRADILAKEEPMSQKPEEAGRGLFCLSQELQRCTVCSNIVTKWTLCGNVDLEGRVGSRGVCVWGLAST